MTTYNLPSYIRLTFKKMWQMQKLSLFTANLPRYWNTFDLLDNLIKIFFKESSHLIFQQFFERHQILVEIKICHLRRNDERWSLLLYFCSKLTIISLLCLSMVLCAIRPFDAFLVELVLCIMQLLCQIQ
jgi:hypothetical protein